LPKKIICIFIEDIHLQYALCRTKVTQR